MPNSCCLCKTTHGNNVPMFYAPTDKSQREEWVRACGVQLTSSSKICALHFKAEDIKEFPLKRRRLRSDAVPSLKLLPAPKANKPQDKLVCAELITSDRKLYMLCCSFCDEEYLLWNWSKFLLHMSEAHESSSTACATTAVQPEPDRPLDNFWQKAAFKPLKIPEGKVNAECQHCSRVLKNTTKSRMQAHRNVCSQPVDDDSVTAEQTIELKSNDSKLEEQQEEHNPLATSFDSFNYVDDDDEIFNFQAELEKLQNLSSNPKQRKLQEKLTKAQAEYHNSRAAHYIKMKENAKLKRAIMVLEARKLQLEIENLKNNY